MKFNLNLIFSFAGIIPHRQQGCLKLFGVCRDEVACRILSINNFPFCLLPSSFCLLPSVFFLLLSSIMNQNISMLIKACNHLGYEYEILHESGNLVVVKNQGKSHIFVNWSTPLNSSSVSHLCRDKEYFYQYFKSYINIPKTKGYLNPNCNELYSSYVKDSNVE